MKEIVTMILFLLMFTPAIIIPNRALAISGLEEVEFSTEQSTLFSTKNLILSSASLAILGIIYHRVPWFHTLITRTFSGLGFIFKNTLLLASYYILPDREQ